MASRFGTLFSALTEYLDADEEGQDRAIVEADGALEAAIVGGDGETAGDRVLDPDEALQAAMALRTRLDERLRRLSGPETEELREDVERLFDLIAYYVSGSGGRH
jgi:hypothetical protein